jgi:hypothetical protein
VCGDTPPLLGLSAERWHGRHTVFIGRQQPVVRELEAAFLAHPRPGPGLLVLLTGTAGHYRDRGWTGHISTRLRTSMCEAGARAVHVNARQSTRRHRRRRRRAAAAAGARRGVALLLNKAAPWPCGARASRGARCQRRQREGVESERGPRTHRRARARSRIHLFACSHALLRPGSWVFEGFQYFKIQLK